MRKYRVFNLLAVTAPLGLALALGGCAARRPPTAEISAADIAIRKAERSNAGVHASLELYQAREALDKARAKATDKRGYDSARRLAEKARADAEFADAKSRAAEAAKAAEEGGKTIEALRSESGRGVSE